MRTKHYVPIVLRFVAIMGVCLSLLNTAIPVQSQSDITQWSAPEDLTLSSLVDTGTFGFLLCDRQENVHLLWSHLSPQGALLLYQNDFTGDLSSPVDVIAFSGNTLIRTSAAISDYDDVLHVIWQDRYIGANVYYSQVQLNQTNNPYAWQAPRRLLENVDSANLVIDNFGTIHVLYGQSEDGGVRNTLYLIKSLDGGENWTDPLAVFQNTAALPSTVSGGLAIDDANRLHVGVTIRTQEYGVYSEVGYLRSIDDGQTWSPYEQIMVDGTTFQGVSTMLPYTFGEDEIHLTWHDPRRMHQWSSDGGETWSAPVEIMSLGAAFGGPNHLVKDSAGILHAIVATGGGVYSATWSGDTWRDYQQIDNRFIDPHGQHMVACQGNQLHAVFYDRLGENKVWYSTRTVAAPHIERQLPTPPTGSLVQLESTPIAAVEPSPTPGPSAVSTRVIPEPPPANTPFHPLLASTAVTLGFLVIIVIGSRKRIR